MTNTIPETPSEPFDPMAGLATLGISAPEPVKVYAINDMDQFRTMISMLAPGEISTCPTADIRPEVAAEIWDSTDMPMPETMVFAGPQSNTPAEPAGINPKDALGLAKVDLSVVPPSALLHLASAMMDGAVKYGPFNWRDKAVLGRVYVAAAMRHMLQYLDGEDIDPTSGVHHLGHAAACCAILLDARETGNLSDNRPKKGVTGEMVRRWTPKTKLG